MGSASIKSPGLQGVVAPPEDLLERTRCLQAELDRALERVQSLEAMLDLTREQLQKSQDGLFTIYTSNGWKLIARCCQVRDLLLPRNSKRYRLAAALGNVFVRLGKRVTKISFQPRIRSINKGYQGWIKRHEPSNEELDRQRHTLLASAPRISLLTVVADPDRALLHTMWESVRAQTYSNWELCLAAADVSQAIRDELLRWEREDPRLRLGWFPSKSGESWSAALGLASGELIARIGQSDALSPGALYEMARALANHPDADVLYSDEDILIGSRRESPLFKPDWSPDTLRSHDYIGDLLLLRRTLVLGVGGFRKEYGDAQWYDVLLRSTEKARRIVHVPDVLYHARFRRTAIGPEHAGCTAMAVVEHLRRIGVSARAVPSERQGIQALRYVHPQRPLISIIIPNKDYAPGLARCVQSVLRSSYERHEILVVENNSVRSETFACYEELRRRPGVRVLEWNFPFNYSALNNFAAGQAAGELLLFLNNDMEVIAQDWLERMLEHALRPEIGAVGAKLCYADGTIQHAGVVIGLREILGHVHRHFPRTSEGYAHRLQIVQNFSAVTAACLMVRKTVFDAVKGFDEDFALDFNDIDLCLRLGQLGYRTVWTPHAELYHFESKTRGYAINQSQQIRFMRETQRFQTKWASLFQNGDPYYNPNLTRDREDFSLGA